jgi:hypothetical protein
MVKIKTRPPGPKTGPTPDFFYRITDSTSYFQYGISARTTSTGAHDLRCAFSYVGPDPSSQYGPIHNNLTPDVFLSHLQGQEVVDGEWGWFISVYDNKEEMEKEVERRKGLGRKDIRTWRVDGKELVWAREKLKKENEDGTEEVVDVDVLTDFPIDWEGQVLFLSVEEVVSKLGLEGRLDGRGVDGEWLALEWIPKEWVVPLKTIK